jgi:hypothetical protein
MPKISQLPEASSIASGDIMTVISGGTNYKIQVQNVNLSALNNDAGFITGVDWNQIGGTQSNVNVGSFANDAGYISNISGQSLSSANNDAGFLTNISGQSLSSANNDAGFASSGSIRWENLGGLQSNINISGFNNNSGYISSYPTTLSSYTNDTNFITGVDWNQIGGSQSSVGLSGFNNDASFITCGDVDGCFSNPNSYISGVAWNEIGGTQNSVGLSGFNNDAGFFNMQLDFQAHSSAPDVTTLVGDFNDLLDKLIAAGLMPPS